MTRYIKKLVLNFKFLSAETHDELVEFDDVERTLEVLLSHSPLEEIRHNGILYPQWLSRISDIPTLKVLRIRETPFLAPSARDSIAIPESRILNWANLRQMSLLRVLHVSRLLASEALGLAQVVRSLSNLEELFVGVSAANKGAEALRIFLEACFLTTEIEAQSSVKRLSLVDCNHLQVL